MKHLSPGKHTDNKTLYAVDFSAIELLDNNIDGNLTVIS